MGSFFSLISLRLTLYLYYDCDLCCGVFLLHVKFCIIEFECLLLSLSLYLSLFLTISMSGFAIICIWLLSHVIASALDISLSFFVISHYFQCLYSFVQNLLGPLPHTLVSMNNTQNFKEVLIIRL